MRKSLTLLVETMMIKQPSINAWYPLLVFFAAVEMQRFLSQFEKLNPDSDWIKDFLPPDHLVFKMKAFPINTRPIKY